MLSAPEDSRCVYQHGEPQLLRYKRNDNKKNLGFFFSNESVEEEEVDYPVLNVTAMPIPCHKTFVQVTRAYPTST